MIKQLFRPQKYLNKIDAAGGSGSIRINHGTASAALTLTINRTVRVPDNQDTNMLPPSLGHFPLFKVQDYADRMPSDMVAKGGLFFPMYQREAMWINFTALRPFALKVYVGGVNAVSGFPMQENETTRQKRLKMLKDGKRIQDYMVVPDQRWLDGIASEDGKIRQFIAKPKGSGFSVEAQVTGEEKVGGVQIEVIPIKCEFPRDMDVRYENQQGQVIKRTLVMADKRLSDRSTVSDLKDVLSSEFGIAVQDQWLETEPHNMDSYNALDQNTGASSPMLGSLYFKPNATLKLSHKHREPLGLYGGYSSASPPLGCMFGASPATLSVETGSNEAMPPPSAPLMSKSNYGAACQLVSLQNAVLPVKLPSPRGLGGPASMVKEMGLAAGGFIQQTIEPDSNPSSIWDAEASILLNLQILDSESFCDVTGLPPPPTPIDAETYAQHGYPFFEIWGEEKTGVKGDFDEVKNVAQIEAERAREKGEKVVEEESVPQRVHIIGQFKSTFQPVEVLKKDLERLMLGV
ncbi:hypothetical protein BKA67DRAFT_676351 [Truncatella angustata]|uniref:Integral membrane protein n=1 Tax=Truncatella angustata TaxID=152316 RepID=A0A9P8UKU6_9PEZI|nr:uncharacterized protein BKA67DRAFT_676351 [Truncatella angustata]KAH6653835.1 hypothetical protein BKA67DRAFT_676351 [Truncatella angustata]